MVCYITFFFSGNQGFFKKKVCDSNLDCSVKVFGVFVTVIETALAAFDHDYMQY